MTSKVLMLAWGLSLISLTVAADPLLWRDGYKDRKGNFVKADWQIFNSPDGAQFAIDMKSVRRIGSDNNVIRVTAYLITSDEFDPDNLIRLAFDCKNRFFEAVSNAGRDRISSAEKRAHELACH